MGGNGAAGGEGGGKNSNVPRWLAMFVSFLCFLPRPLHGLAMKLDCSPLRPLLGWLGILAGSWQHAHKRRTSNVLPSTITSAP